MWKKASDVSSSFPLGSFDLVFSNSMSWEQSAHLSPPSSFRRGGLAAVSDGRVSELLIDDLCVILLRSQASGQLSDENRCPAGTCSRHWFVSAEGLAAAVMLNLSPECWGNGLRCAGWSKNCFRRDQSMLPGSVVSDCSLVCSIK